MAEKVYYSGFGKIVFMAVSKPQIDKKDPKKKPTYTVKVDIDGNTPEGLSLRKQLSAINPKKIVLTKSVKNSDGVVEPQPLEPGHFQVSFYSQNQPLVLVDKQIVKGADIPYFDGRTDKGEVNVGYTISEYEGKRYVWLNSVGIRHLEQADRQGSTSTADLEKQVKEMQAMF